MFGFRPGFRPLVLTVDHALVRLLDGGVAVDLRGDIYVGEVSWSAYGRLLDPPRTVRSFRKLVKVG